MGKTFGRQVLSPVAGTPLQVLADGDSDGFKAGGITLDWSLFAAVSGAAVTLLDSLVIAIGKKYARYGQIVCKVTAPEVQTITVANASGGDFTAAGSGAIAWNASLAAVKAALELVFGAGMITSVTGTPGASYVVTFDDSLGNVAAMTIVDSTTGSGHSVVVTTSNQGAGNVGKYGPYDPAATDGRQTLSRGSCWILNETVLEDGLDAFVGAQSNHPPVFDGGTVWKARLLMTSGTHSLAAGPTVTEFETAFPRIQYVTN